MESTGEKRCGVARQVCETDQILAAEGVAGEAEVQGLGFAMVAGFEPGEWQGEEVVRIGSNRWLSAEFFGVQLLATEIFALGQESF